MCVLCVVYTLLSRARTTGCSDNNDARVECVYLFKVYIHCTTAGGAASFRECVGVVVSPHHHTRTASSNSSRRRWGSRGSSDTQPAAKKSSKKAVPGNQHCHIATPVALFYAFFQLRRQERKTSST